MRLPGTTFCILVLISVGCQRSRPADNVRILADSALSVHFRRLEKLRHYDSGGIEQGLLRAIEQADSVWLKNYLAADDEQYSDRRITMFADSSLGLTPLDALGADEAYRFHSESAFASSVNSSPPSNLVSYTITRSGGKVQLQTIRGLYETVADSDWTFRTTIHYKHDTVLAVKHWESLEKALWYCDFWGMKSSNDDYGNDGSTVSIEGYRRSKPNQSRAHHYVFRWAPYGTALDSPMAAIRRLSDGCPGYY